MDSTGVSSTTLATSGAYSAGDVVGGLVALDVPAIRGDSGILQSLQMIDGGNNGAEFVMILFDDNPSLSTFTDNSAPSINALDLPKVVATVHIAAADWVSVAGVGYYAKAVSQAVRAKAGVDGGNPTKGVMYAALVCVATPTVNNGTLTYRLGIMWG